MYKVPWHVWLPPLSLGLHLHHHWSCGVCIQVVAIWQFMMTMVLDHNVNDVRWKNKTERIIVSLIDFDSSSVPLVFISGLLGGVSKFSDTLLRSLISQVMFFEKQ